jgi:hypothetical protein
VHGNQPDLGFEWLRGYAAFSVNQSIVPNVDRYIAQQEEHHAKTTFIDEPKNPARAQPGAL